MENSKSHNKYLGKWILLPELCLYEEGESPKFGVYEIAQYAGKVHISISWQTGDGNVHKIKFDAPENGIKTPVQYPGVTHLSITQISDSILDSRAFLEEKEIAYARRCVSLDGQLLSTLQIEYRTDGSAVRKFQVYRRGGTKDTPL